MKVWTCTGFTGHYPVGTSAVIVAKTEERARELLASALQEAHLDPQSAFDVNTKVTLLDTNNPQAIVLQDGNY